MRMIKLYNIQQLFNKTNLTASDTRVLEQFVNATRKEIEHTTYVANTAVYPSSWGHTTTVLSKKLQISLNKHTPTSAINDDYSSGE